jgi:hypothetical protein
MAESKTTMSSDDVDDLKDRLRNEAKGEQNDASALRILCLQAASMIDYLQWKLRDR